MPARKNKVETLAIKAHAVTAKAVEKWQPKDRQARKWSREEIQKLKREMEAKNALKKLGATNGKQQSVYQGKAPQPFQELSNKDFKHWSPNNTRSFHCPSKGSGSTAPLPASSKTASKHTRSVHCPSKGSGSTAPLPASSKTASKHTRSFQCPSKDSGSTAPLPASSRTASKHTSEARTKLLPSKNRGTKRCSNEVEEGPSISDPVLAQKDSKRRRKHIPEEPIQPTQRPRIKMRINFLTQSVRMIIPPAPVAPVPSNMKSTDIPPTKQVSGKCNLWQDLALSDSEEEDNVLPACPVKLPSPEKVKQLKYPCISQDNLTQKQRHQFDDLLEDFEKNIQ